MGFVEFNANGFYKHFTPPGIALANSLNKLVSVMKTNEAIPDQAMNDEEFWLKVGEVSLDRIWNNPDDDVYAELLECDVDPVKQ